jgi:hypothetical protein
MKDVSDVFRMMHQMIAIHHDTELSWAVKNKVEAALWGRLWTELEPLSFCIIRSYESS